MQFSFNIQWHYALDIPGESDESKYLSRKTLWGLRHPVVKEKIDVPSWKEYAARPWMSWMCQYIRGPLFSTGRTKKDSAEKT